MSEQEFTKWKNKYRLWRIMHPWATISCKPCRYWPWDNENHKKICPKNILVLAWDETGDGWVKELDNYPQYNGDFVCIEWIKDV